MKALILLTFLLAFPSLCFAQNRNGYFNPYPLPEVQKQLDELPQWHSKISTALKKQPCFDSMMSSLDNTLKPHDVLKCHIFLSKTGRIEKLRVFPMNNKSRNLMVQYLIKSAEPFPAPPNDLPFKKGMRIDFTKTENSVEMSFRLSEYPGSRIGDSGSR